MPKLFQIMRVVLLDRVVRRAWWLGILVLPLLLPVAVLAVADPATPPGPATPADSGHAPDRAALSGLVSTLAAGKKPVVILFSTPGCPYCRALRREHLDALDREQERLGLLYVEIDLADRRALASDPGARRPAVLDGLDSGRDLARRLSVRLAPTLIFLGPEGEIAERLVGYGSRDFYAGYLDQRLDEARQRLRAD